MGADDRRALMLAALPEAETWGGFETALNDRVLRVYELESDRIQIDIAFQTNNYIITVGKPFTRAQPERI
jgi:hypothetical protein